VGEVGDRAGTRESCGLAKHVVSSVLELKLMLHPNFRSRKQLQQI